MKNKYRTQKNTDSIDIDEKRTGVDAWQVGDSTSKLNSRRGLHIQIRHNGDEPTFLAACELASLITASPDLLYFAKMMLEYFHLNSEAYEPKEYKNLRKTCEAVIAKAEGNT